jgi:hypothetical protein
MAGCIDAIDTTPAKVEQGPASNIFRIMGRRHDVATAGIGIILWVRAWLLCGGQRLEWTLPVSLAKKGGRAAPFSMPCSESNLTSYLGEEAPNGG